MPNDAYKSPMYLGHTGHPEDFNEPVLLYPGQLGGRVVFNPDTRSAPGTETGTSRGYQLVGTDSTMSVAPFPGAVAWWADKAKYQVTTSPTATARAMIAGVFGRTSITRGNYCYIQFRGPQTTKFIDASMAALAVGDNAIPSATAGKAERIAAGTAPTYPALGVVKGGINLIEATAVVDLNVPETT